MRRRSRNYNSPESRKKRSDRARKGAEATNRVKASKREPYVELPEDLFKITTENLITGKITVVTAHRGTRRNNLRFCVDGEHWKTCGVIRAEGLILKSLFATVCGWKFTRKAIVIDKMDRLGAVRTVF